MSGRRGHPHVETRNVAALLCAGDPTADAIVDRRDALTFEQIDRAAASAAAYLRHLGFRRGERIAVFLPMSCDLYIALLAIFRAGLVAVFIDPHAGPGMLDRCASLLELRGFLSTGKGQLLRIKSPHLRRVPTALSAGFPWFPARAWSAWKQFAPDSHFEDCGPDAPALITFTSGSTGLPKIAVRTHGFLAAQHSVLAEELKVGAGDVVLCSLPIFGLTHLGSGATTIVPDADLRRVGAISPGPLLEQIARRHVTHLEGSPAFLTRILEECERRKSAIPEVRGVFTGGAPVFPRLLDRLQDVFPKASIWSFYGSTEAEPIAHSARHETTETEIQAMVRGRGLLTGTPIERIDLQIIRDEGSVTLGPFSDAEFDEQCVPDGSPGEIVVTGEHVLQGYHDGRGDEENKIRVGARIWHRTGDAGYLDERGRLWLLGRCSARISLPDRTMLYPFAVECAAMQHPRVTRAGLVEVQGARVLAVEITQSRSDGPAGAATEGESKTHGAAPNMESVRREIAEALSWAPLDHVIVLNRIPVDARHNAKVDYPKLRELIRLPSR